MLLSFQFIFNILLGQSCVGCKRLGTLLCQECEENLPSSLERRLPGNIITCLSYRDERVRKLIGMLKFRSASSVAGPLGRILSERMLEDLGDSLFFSGMIRNEDFSGKHSVSRRSGSRSVEEKNPHHTAPLLLLVPVPLSPARLRMRGYNQAELLARALLNHATSTAQHGSPTSARAGGIFFILQSFLPRPKSNFLSSRELSSPFELAMNALTKVRDTKRQVETASRDERLLNLRGAFRADPKRVCNRHVILIDDVATTGTTLLEGKRSLLTAGAASVTCLALAH